VKSSLFFQVSFGSSPYFFVLFSGGGGEKNKLVEVVQGESLDNDISWYLEVINRRFSSPGDYSGKGEVVY